MYGKFWVVIFDRRTDAYSVKSIAATAGAFRFFGTAAKSSVACRFVFRAGEEDGPSTATPSDRLPSLPCWTRPSAASFHLSPLWPLTWTNATPPERRARSSRQRRWQVAARSLFLCAVSGAGGRGNL